MRPHPAPGAGTGGYQRKDGKWVEATSAGGPTGARMRRYVYADTREEAQEKLRKLLYERDRGLLADPGKQTVGEFLASWLRDVVQPSVRPRTYRNYAGVVKTHINPVLEEFALRSLSPQHLQRFYREKQEQGLTRTGAALSRRPSPRPRPGHEVGAYSAQPCRPR